MRKTKPFQEFSDRQALERARGGIIMEDDIMMITDEDTPPGGPHVEIIIGDIIDG